MSNVFGTLFLTVRHMRWSIILLLAAASAGAQQTLTLQDAIALAQKEGPQAQIARSQIDAARYRNDAFNANLLPQMRLEGDAAKLNHGITSIAAADGSTQFTKQAQNESTIGLAIDQRVP